MVLQGQALQPWTALSPVHTSPSWVSGVLVTGEALDGAWGGCTKGGCGWVRRASMMSARSCKHGRRASGRHVSVHALSWEVVNR